MKSWILVADSSEARVFESDRIGKKKWRLVHQLEHPASRARGADLVTDRAGRGEERGELPRDHEARKFAIQLGDILTTSASQNLFDRIVLIGPPRFLGLLREKVSKAVLERVMEEIPKDFIHLKEHEVRERVHEQLAI